MPRGNPRICLSAFRKYRIYANPIVLIWKADYDNRTTREKTAMERGRLGEERTRDRIIPNIVSLNQALKVEKDVQSAYHALIEENISYWWAVEEDAIESYLNLMNTTDNEKVKSTLSKIIEDSKDHIEVLESMKESFRKILADEQRHARMLQELNQELTGDK